MVVCSPDPSTKPDDNFIPGDVGLIVSTDSDSESEEISYEGYEVLPQEPIPVADMESEESGGEDRNDNITLTDIREPPSFDQSTKAEVAELWNSSSSGQKDIPMDSDKQEQIKNAMAGFRLPSSAIPSWAADISEEEWKEQIKQKVIMLSKVSSV